MIEIQLGNEDNNITYQLDKHEAREFAQRMQSRNYDNKIERTRAIADILGDMKGFEIEIPEPTKPRPHKLVGRIALSLLIGFLAVSITQLIFSGDIVPIATLVSIITINTLIWTYQRRTENGLRKKMQNMRRKINY